MKIMITCAEFYKIDEANDKYIFTAPKTGLYHIAVGNLPKEELLEISVNNDVKFINFRTDYASVLFDLNDLDEVGLTLKGNPKTGCNHKWKKYTGLSESYQYCEVCDAKK